MHKKRICIKYLRRFFFEIFFLNRFLRRCMPQKERKESPLSRKTVMDLLQTALTWYNGSSFTDRIDYD